MATELTARATRSGEWWAVQVDEIPGLFTQAKRLNKVAELVLDAASALTEQEASEFTVSVVPELDDETRTAVEAAATRREAAREAAELKDASDRIAVTKLRAEGFTEREAAVVLGVSYQRVHQLAS